MFGVLAQIPGNADRFRDQRMNEIRFLCRRDPQIPLVRGLGLTLAPFEARFKAIWRRSPGQRWNHKYVEPHPPSRNNVIRPFDKRPRLGHIGDMSAIAKSRIDPELKRQAEAVLEEIGLKPRAALELFYKQIIKRRAIPFPVQADSPEDDVLSSAARRNKLADEF